LQLSAEELDVLDDVLSAHLGDLKEQIYKADVFEVKEQLRTREALVLQLLQRLRAQRASAAA
jgi:hypothetical protein